MKKYIYPLLGLALFTMGCSDDDSIKNGPTPKPTPEADVTVQHFMWQAMNLWYFWQDDVNDLKDSRFTSDAQYTDFLEAHPDPAKALCDGPCALPLDRLEEFLREAQQKEPSEAQGNDQGNDQDNDQDNP